MYIYIYRVFHTYTSRRFAPGEGVFFTCGRMSSTSCSVIAPAFTTINSIISLSKLSAIFHAPYIQGVSTHAHRGLLLRDADTGFFTCGRMSSTSCSAIISPFTSILSRKQDTCGETKSPVLIPPSCSDRAILRATDPCKWCVMLSITAQA